MSEKETWVDDSGSNEVRNRISGFFGVSNDELKPVLEDHVLMGHLASKVQEFNGLQSANMRLHATVDELKTLCTSKVDSLKSELERLARESDTSKRARDHLEEQVSQLTREKVLAVGQTEKYKFELQSAIEQKEALKSNKQDVVRLLEEKISELESSKSESQDLLQENKRLRQQLLETQNEVQVLKCNELGERSELEVAKQQASMLTKSNEWLEKEVNSKTEQLIKYREKNDTELQQTLQEVSNLKNNYELEKSSKEFLSKRVQEMTESLQEKLLEVKQLSDALNIEKQEFSREMSLKQKLLDLQDEQLHSLQEELRINEQKRDSSAVDVSRSSEQAKLVEDMAHLRQRFEESEHERLRLQDVVKEVLADDEEFDSKSVARLSVPKLYGDLGVLKKQMINERLQKESLQRQIESFVVELEYKVPVINSLKERSSTLEKELSDVALLLEHTSTEKEKKARELESAMGKIKQLEINTHTLIRQRSDLARQIQFLLYSHSLQNDSRGPLTPEEVSFIKRIIENEDPSSESDSQSVISERLLEFKDVAALQEKNAELVKTARILADKLEEEEKSSNERTDSLERKTIEEAKEAIVTLQERNSEIEGKLITLEKERDAFKAILAQKGEQFDNLRDSAAIKDETRQQDSIKGLEDKLSTLAAEASKNNELLNQEIMNLYKSKTQVTINYEKERSSKTLAEERLKLMHSTLETTKNDNSNLIKRSDELQTTLIKQEARNAETLNNYISCQSKLSVLESKAANLEAERSLLQSSGDSLRTELRNISVERNTLKIMVTQLQTLQSERESLLKDSHTAHKSAVAQLESQISDTKASLAVKDTRVRELEESKSTQALWYQEKINTMMTDASAIKNELASKSASIGELESLVNDLRVQLKDNGSRIAVYKTWNSDNADTSEAQLRKDLEKMMIELKHAYSQLEEYKKISSAADDSLESLSKEWRVKNEALESKAEHFLAEKLQMEASVEKLKKNIDFLNNEYALQKNRSEEEKNEIMKKLVSLEVSDRSLNQVREEYQEKLSQLQADLSQQTSYTDIARKNYEEELQKHAEDSKTITQMRSEVQSDRSEIQRLEASKKQAEDKLESAEKSWSTQRAELESHFEDLNRQIEDLSSQNKLLLDQVELLSTGQGDHLTESMTENGKELFTSLRRERDVLETKLAVSKREENQLHQKQLVVEGELAEMRKKLLELQENDSSRLDIAQQHDDIIEQLNQMNLLRESNVTLRNIANAAQERNSELQTELDELHSKLIPLNSEISCFRKSIDEKDQRIKMLTEEAERWKERSHEILRRHEQIDPDEYKQLEKEIVELKEQVEAKSKDNADLDDRFTRLKKQAHEKLNASKIAQTNLNAELNELHETKIKMEEILKETQNKVYDLERSLTEKNSESVTIDTLRNELDSALERSKEIERKLEEALGSSDGITAQLNGEIESLKEEVRALKEKESNLTEQDFPNQDLSQVVESMKKAFEDEKIKFILEKTEEYNKKFEEEKSKLSSGDVADRNNTVDIDNLKKQWEQEYEASSLQRIQEAEDNLKKRIRMPTEDRIKKVLEKRKAELEEEFQRRLKENNLGSEAGDTNTQEELKKKIEKELEAKYEEALTTTKKKAFEEGKQQAAMKSTLLERKIAKLETQLSESKKPILERPASIPAVSSGLPTKIDEKRTNDTTAESNGFGEKVLKLSDKPAFSFQPSVKSNPFTSALPANTNAFGMKPTFSFTPESSQSDKRPVFGSTGFNPAAEAGIKSPSSEIAEEALNQEGNIDIGQEERHTTQNGESAPVEIVATAQKRPADDQSGDESPQKREKQ